MKKILTSLVLLIVTLHVSAQIAMPEEEGRSRHTIGIQSNFSGFYGITHGIEYSFDATPRLKLLASIRSNFSPDFPVNQFSLGFRYKVIDTKRFDISAGIDFQKSVMYSPTILGSEYPLIFGKTKLMLEGEYQFSNNWSGYVQFNPLNLGCSTSRHYNDNYASLAIGFRYRMKNRK